MICAECKREIPETSQACQACGAPLTSLARARARAAAMTDMMRAQAQAHQHPPDAPPDLPADPIGLPAQPTVPPADAVDQRVAAGNSRNAAAITVVALVSVVALVALVGAVIFVIAIPHPTAARHLAKRTRPVPTWTWYLTWSELQPGDCLTGSNLGLGTDSPFPEAVMAVRCTQQHLAEVYFAGNLWPESLAKYPGDSVASDAADARCRAAFSAYVGIDISQSALSYDYWYPAGGSDWLSGDRQVVCVAYFPNVPFSSSVKGTGA